MNDLPTSPDANSTALVAAGISIASSPDADKAAQAAADQREKDILDEAKERFELAKEAESDIRRLALDDLNFRAGEQWPQKIQQDRESDGRPCLVINRIPQFVQQVTNDQRQNRPSIKVHPVGDGADVATAKKIQGLIKHIEYNSNADVAYDTGFEGAATGGFGFWRVVPDFVSPDSFDQELFIKRIRNQFSVYLDPYAQEPDGSDAAWGFIVDSFSKDLYDQKYPDSKLASMSDWKSIGDTDPSWMQSDGTATVAEYFYKEYQNKTIYLLSTGDTVSEEKLQERLEAAQAAGIQPHIVRQRQAKVPVIKWLKINAMEILEETIFPGRGRYIPIVPVYGTELYIDGKRILEGVVRNAKDPQRMYNFWASAETEAIALAPKAPYLVAEGQVEGYEKIWENSNRRNLAYLPYKATTIAGQPAPPPQRASFDPAVQAITQARMLSADDLKATTGIYDASLGAQSADTSGLAIQRRNTQSQTSNFHFMDNLSRSMRHTGRILVDAIPFIYDTPRTSRIIGDDGTQEMVKLNQPTDQKGDDGQPLIYRLDTGTYDVTVDVGPSFASKRQEAAASMQSLAQSYPEIMKVAGDLFVKNMDWPGAQEISDRIRKMMPPGLADEGKGPKIPPQAQAMLQQQAHMIQNLSKELHQAADEIRVRKIEHESRERIEMAKIQADIEINLAKLGSQAGIELLKQEVGAIRHRLELLGENDQPDATLDGFTPQDAGGPPAQGAPQMQPPTGGPPPGNPMQGLPST